MDSACFKVDEKVYFKLWVKLGCTPRRTQIVPKWHLASQLAGSDFFNTGRQHDAQQKCLFSAGLKLGGFGFLENAQKSVFEFMGPAGVFPAMYPNSAKMAFGWPRGWNRFFQHVRKSARKVYVKLWVKLVSP